jgi:hypothetical protein
VFYCLIISPTNLKASFSGSEIVGWPPRCGRGRAPRPRRPATDRGERRSAFTAAPEPRSTRAVADGKCPLPYRPPAPARARPRADPIAGFGSFMTADSNRSGRRLIRARHIAHFLDHGRRASQHRNRGPGQPRHVLGRCLGVAPASHRRVVGPLPAPPSVTPGCGHPPRRMRIFPSGRGASACPRHLLLALTEWRPEEWLRSASCPASSARELLIRRNDR